MRAPPVDERAHRDRQYNLQEAADSKQSLLDPTPQVRAAGKNGNGRASPPADTSTAGDAPGANSVAVPAAWSGPLPAGSQALPTAPVPPVRIQIPAVGLDAEVMAVGIHADGALGLPTTPGKVGWFHGGPSPGESGVALLAAHVDFDGREGSFFRLAELAAGSVVVVERSDGSVSRFRTDAPAQLHRKSALPTEVLFGRGGSATLALVTCGGEFDPVRRSYESNVVVTAS